MGLERSERELVAGCALVSPDGGIGYRLRGRVVGSRRPKIHKIDRPKPTVAAYVSIILALFRSLSERSEPWVFGGQSPRFRPGTRKF
jgi:hypothetical protein